MTTPHENDALETKDRAADASDGVSGAAKSPLPARRRRIFGFLEADAWIDTTVYRIGSGFVEAYERLIVFMRRFRARGLKRAVVEVAGDGLTLGTAGFVLMLAFGLSAFPETQKDWRRQVDYSATFLDRYGNEVGKRGILHNAAVDLDEMPDHFIKAVLATEDRRFFEHFGIDVFGTARAVVENARNRSVVQGGSSLSQQLAKNLFLTNERTLERKIKEAFLALWLEANLTKRDILKLYLDRAYMGGGTFGAAAAAEFYFGKSIKEVNLSEAAMLAGLFKAPTKFAPHINLPAARARANEVLSNLVQAGFMTEGQVVAARRFPATPTNTARAYAPDYFLDFAFDELRKINPSQHAVTVLTTIDVGIQQRSEDSVEATLRQYGAEYDVSQASIVLTEPEGAIRAMVGGRDYGASQFNRAVTAARQPGSAFKPFVYAVALENGFKADSAVVDQPTCIGNWCPKNYAGRFSGRMTLTQALTVSINTIPVQLTRSLGRETVARAAAAMGINVPPKPDWPFVLGAVDTNPYEMVGGYATFANGGYHVAPYAIDQIMDASGTVIYDRKRDGPQKKRVIGAEAVADLNAMMRSVVVNGTGKRTQVPGVPIAGKTGTTSAYRDAWFVGYSGNYVAAVWVGNDDYRPMNRVTGGLLPAMAFQSIMAFAHQNIDVKPLFGVPFEPGMGPTAPVAVVDPNAAPDAAAASILTVARPRALSSRTAGVLMSIADTIERAPAVKPRPEALARPREKRAEAQGLTPIAGDGGARSGGLTTLR